MKKSISLLAAGLMLAAFAQTAFAVVDDALLQWPYSGTTQPMVRVSHSTLACSRAVARVLVIRSFVCRSGSHAVLPCRGCRRV